MALRSIYRTQTKLIKRGILDDLGPLNVIVIMIIIIFLFLFETRTGVEKDDNNSLQPFRRVTPSSERNSKKDP